MTEMAGAVPRSFVASLGSYWRLWRGFAFALIEVVLLFNVFVAVEVEMSEDVVVPLWGYKSCNMPLMPNPLRVNGSFVRSNDMSCDGGLEGWERWIQRTPFDAVNTKSAQECVRGSCWDGLEKILVSHKAAIVCKVRVSVKMVEGCTHE